MSAFGERSKDLPRTLTGRISRRLSLGLALFLMLVLVVGGISILLARSIWESTVEIGDSSEKIKRIEGIHFTAHHLIEAVHHAVISGRPYPEDLYPELIPNLARQVEEYPNRFDPASQKDNEVKTMHEMAARISDLSVLARRIIEGAEGGGKATPEDLEALKEFGLTIHEKAEKITHIHLRRITKFAQDSSKQMKFIIGIYLAFIAMGSLLLGAASFVLAKTVDSPIRRLASATLEVARGDFDRRVPVTSTDELGQLSHSFNIMAETLAEHERQLMATHEQLERKAREAEALYKIGMEILGLLDLGKVLHSVVEKAKELLGCEVGALCLLDGEERQLVPRVTSGPPEAFGGGRSTRVDRGLAVTSLGHCLAANGAGGPKRPLVCCGVISPQYLKTHLAVSLKRGERVIGVFCVADKRLREFSTAEVDLLSGLATQAAIAIENARLYDKTRSLAILEERERIAREMHDGLAQALASLHFQISRAQALLKANETARVQATMERTRKIAESAYEDIRQAIFGLRTMVSRSLGLVPTLTEYLHDWNLQSGVTADLQIRDEWKGRLSPEAELQLIRIIQEALANVRKHAAARHAQVRFELEGDHVLVTVADDGKGFDPAELPRRKGKCFGLETMRERAEAVGGSLKVQSQRGRGTSVSVRLPFSGERRS